MASPPVPGASDALHSSSDVQQYAAWLSARMGEWDNVIGAVNGVDLPSLMGSNGQAAAMGALPPLVASTQPQAAALLPDWVKFRQTWNAFAPSVTTGGGPLIGGIPAWQVLSPAIAALTLAQGNDPWNQIRSFHGQLLNWAPRFTAAGLTPPDLAPLPESSRGGPSPTTIAVFTAGVGLLGAYVGWELAPLPEKPIGALIGAGIGAGVTFFVLR